ncbi:MAG: HDOD domain-containing protein [Alteromonadaceae bacterium]|nr:HDOD domain-containing protein [Alteromonadaceae bacterium]
MSGLFSWITNLFSRQPPPPVDTAPGTRLFNPADPEKQDAPQSPDDWIAQLEYNLFAWLLETEPKKLESSPASQEPFLQALEERINNGKLEELPRQPGTLPLLLQALSAETTERREISRIILSDPVLTEHLLQIVNSPFFRYNQNHIESVDQAVFVLGLNGIRSVAAAAMMRPMMSARNSREALFAQRAWRWALTCARATEMIAKRQGEDTSAYFVLGLMPGLAYLTIRRELVRISRLMDNGPEPQPELIHAAITRYQWHVCQVLANTWNLPPKYHAWLLATERPAPNQPHSPLTDGLLLGSREILRHAHQRNLPEQELYEILHLAPEDITRVRNTLVDMLEEGKTSPTSS